MVDGSLQFNKTISTPTVADLAKILADNVRNGTVTLQIDPTTIKVTDASGNVGQCTWIDMFSCNDPCVVSVKM